MIALVTDCAAMMEIEYSKECKSSALKKQNSNDKSANINWNFVHARCIYRSLLYLGFAFDVQGLLLHKKLLKVRRYPILFKIFLIFSYSIIG